MINKVDSYPLTVKDLDDRGVRNLAKGICLQAVVDYKRGKRMLMRDKDYHPSEDFESASAFLRSPQFRYLSGLDNQRVMDSIHETLDNELKTGKIVKED